MRARPFISQCGNGTPIPLLSLETKEVTLVPKTTAERGRGRRLIRIPFYIDAREGELLPKAAAPGAVSCGNSAADQLISQLKSEGLSTAESPQVESGKRPSIARRPSRVGLAVPRLCRVGAEIKALQTGRGVSSSRKGPEVTRKGRNR